MRGLYNKWGATLVVAEENGIGDPVISIVREANLPVRAININNTTKAHLIDQLVIAFERVLPEVVSLTARRAITTAGFVTGVKS